MNTPDQTMALSGGAQRVSGQARPPRNRLRNVLYAAILAALLAGAVHPLRRYVEHRRQLLLGRLENPSRRLSEASQFGFVTAAGASVRIVPGRPALELGDLPVRALTLILGGFRGPYVVWLWMAAEEEKHEKIHFDLIDRYTKIAAIQGDYPQMWTFHMWNLAWNISAQWHSLEHKYQWIRRAVDFGTAGYRRNPHNAAIMAALGRIYGDKLGRSQEAPYYRRRVREDEGRSTFLIAYEWYDRARKANDLYDTLGGGLSDPVVYSQACHSVSYYATELTLQAYGALEASVAARREGHDAASRRRFREGLETLDESIGAWKWARREWQDHALRWENKGLSVLLSDVYKRFYAEAEAADDGLQTFRSRLTYDNLPRYHAAALTWDAFKAMEDSLEPREQGHDRAARNAFTKAQKPLAEAIDAWEWVGRMRPEDAAFLAGLRRFQSDLTYENLPRYKAAKLTQEARNAFQRSLDARKEGRGPEARDAFNQGLHRLSEALHAWRRAGLEWAEAVSRLQEPMQTEAAHPPYPQWLDEAKRFVGNLREVGPRLTYENLPDLFPQIAHPPVEWPEPPVTWPARDLWL